MKTILIILGWSAGQIQERSSAALDVADLYDIDARHFRGPLSIRYQVKDAFVEMPEAELASLSFTGGILTSATVNPHLRPLDGSEAARLCRNLEEAFSRWAAFVFPASGEFQAFAESLKSGHVRYGSLPPWRFASKLEGDAVNFVVRPFESPSSPTAATSPLYMIAVEFGNSKIADEANAKIDAVRAKAFPGRRGRIRMSEYPKR
jgi:hypothetical protein